MQISGSLGLIDFELFAGDLSELTERQKRKLCEILTKLLYLYPVLASVPDLKHIRIVVFSPEDTESIFVWHDFMPSDNVEIQVRVRFADAEKLDKSLKISITEPGRFAEAYGYLDRQDLEFVSGDRALLEKYAQYILDRVIPLLRLIYCQ